MKNYNWTTFTKKIAIKADIQDIYNAWTIPQEIEKWFLSKAVFENSQGEMISKDQNISVGDKYKWSWFLYDIVEEGKVKEANGCDSLKFTFAGNCQVTVDLTAQKGLTIVKLTQNNIPTDDASKREIRLGCDAGWSFFLLNLKSVFEGGIDLRNKDESLEGMLNN
jgi:uncharacterized protein YndB with AHSA1/START domain